MQEERFDDAGFNRRGVLCSQETLKFAHVISEDDSAELDSRGRAKSHSTSSALGLRPLGSGDVERNLPDSGEDDRGRGGTRRVELSRACW